MQCDTIVYTHPIRLAFVAKDIEALRKHYRVFEHSFNSGPALLLPWDLFRQFIFLLVAKWRGAHVAIVHFAGYHSILPVLLGFHTYLIVAGSDSCSFPGIDYGSFRKNWMSKAMSYSFRRARGILPVHSSLENFQNTYSNAGPRQQGYAHFVKGKIAPSTAIPYGFDLDLWKFQEGSQRNDRVLCIANGASYGNAIHLRKGIDLLIAAAFALPDVIFTIVGTDASTYKEMPSNIKFLGRISPGTLTKIYAENGIYIQASIMEGFPNALCEAMLMGCIPIVSNITSMPAIIGDAGEVISWRDSDLLISAIQKIRSLPDHEMNELRDRARQRVSGLTIRKRLEVLIKTISHDQW